MNTPNGKRRRVRMSLVHSADIETPDKRRARQSVQQTEEDEANADRNNPAFHTSVDSSPTSVKAKRRVSLFAPGDAEATNNQAQTVASPTLAVSEFLRQGVDRDEVNRRGRQSITVAPSTPPQYRGGAIPQTEPHRHRIMSADIALLFSDNGVEVMKGSKGLDSSSPRHYSPQVVSHNKETQASDEIFDEFIVLDDQLEADDQEASSDSPSSSKQELAAPAQGLGIRDHESPSKSRRRSSILERVWPFGSPARSPETDAATEPQHEIDAQTWPEAADAKEDHNSSGSLEEAAEVDGAQDLETNRESRSALGLNSPSRLPSSPSFLLDGRRKVSLRTRTLLKSSAVLAEKLEAEAELGICEPAIAEEAPEPSGLAQLAEPFALRSELGFEQKAGKDADSSMQNNKPASVDEDEDEVERSLTTSEDQVPDLSSQPRTSAYKRMSMPTSSVAARRFSLFGGLPKLRSANEAEQVGDASRAERMGHARRKSSFEPSAMNGDLLRAPRDPSLSEATYAQLRMPARDALRYLLSNKPTSVTSPKPEEPIKTPVLQSGPLPAQDSPKTPATPKYEGLRELRLGRADGVDGLDKSRGPKRRSLILSPQVLSSLAPQTAPALSSPVTRESVTLDRTADLIFLSHAMAMPEEDIEGDAYLKGLRYVFRDYRDLLLRDRFEHEDPAQVSALAALLSSPAAHRALLGAAASVGRLSPHETAIQTAALAHKHKKTRRGCRGGRKRSKSHSGAVAGDENADAEDNSTPSSHKDLVHPLESLELNGQEDDGPDSAEVQQVQEIQNLLNRLGPLAINNGVAADATARQRGREQAKEWDQPAPAANERRKSSTTNGAAAHRRKNSTASNVSNASSHGSHDKILQARLSSWDDREVPEAASVAEPDGGHTWSSTSHKGHTDRQENCPTTRSRAPRGGPPSSMASSSNGRASRHTRGQSSGSLLDGSNGGVYTNASDNVQRSPMRPGASGNRGGRRGANAPKAPAANTRSNARVTRSNGNRFSKRDYLASDGPSSDLPEGPQSEPAFGTNGADSGSTGPTTRLRSGRIVRGAH